MPQPSATVQAKVTSGRHRLTPGAVTALARRDNRAGRQQVLTKPLLMVSRDRPAQRALALGGAGDVGDVALLGSSETAFTARLASFWLITSAGSPPCASALAAGLRLARQASPGNAVSG
jgi:hypothetical protein